MGTVLCEKREKSTAENVATFEEDTEMTNLPIKQAVDTTQNRV